MKLSLLTEINKEQAAMLAQRRANERKKTAFNTRIVGEIIKTPIFEAKKIDYTTIDPKKIPYLDEEDPNYAEHLDHFRFLAKEHPDVFKKILRMD